MKINFRPHLRSIISGLRRILSFVVILVLYSFRLLLGRLSRFKIIAKVSRFIDHLLLLIDPPKLKNLRRVDLIKLSIRNMKMKKTRTAVTVGGMSISISFIVFLISIGYGLQNLVISRVASLNELKQADVLPGLARTLSLNDSVISDIKQIPNVKAVYPVIAVVGKISYNSSVFDVAVYGVTTSFLNSSSITPVRGKFFNNDDVTFNTSLKDNSPEKAASKASNQITFITDRKSYSKVRSSASIEGDIVGYTKVTGETSGIQEIGGSYSLSSIETDNKWIGAVFPLWKKVDGQFVLDTDSSGEQKQVKGFIAQINTTVALAGQSDANVKVLGVTTTSSGSLPLVEVASESGSTATQNVQVVGVTSTDKKEAVVNLATLELLGLNEAEAVGKKFSMYYVVLNDLIPDNKNKVQSLPVEYTITGVTNDKKTALIYVPFIDTRSLGVTNYSQLKMVVSNQSQLAQARKTVESQGYGTVSVVDTVQQINNLFDNIRLLLIVIGAVALSVASLGMFNTLTVSLLERTREVGLMKAMGMKSSEVKDLYLTESMVMGLLGGVIGMFLGGAFGVILSAILSITTLVHGAGFILLTSLPLPFIALVIVLSLIIGVFTGLYPARRAMQIPALDALRYE